MNKEQNDSPVSPGENGEPRELPLQPDFTTLQTLEDFKNFAKTDQLQPGEVYQKSLEGATALLGAGEAIIEAPTGLPTLVVSDIHGRRTMIADLLAKPAHYFFPDLESQSTTVFDLLQQRSINLIFLGDYVHTETPDAWPSMEAIAESHLDSELRTEKISKLHKQACESLGAAKMVMDLQRLQPKHVFSLKGNHDEHDREKWWTPGITKAFSRKYIVPQGDLMIEWFEEYSGFGRDFFTKWTDWESKLPLVVYTKLQNGAYLANSHAIPSEVLSREDIEERSPVAIGNLLWTNNTPAAGSDEIVERITQALVSNVNAILKLDGEVTQEQILWIVGHRKAYWFRSLANDRVIQINNPENQVVAVVPADGSFKPKRNVRFINLDLQIDDG